MRDVVDILKALADTNRVRALLALGDGEVCVCQLIELLGLAPSSVSKHMSILRQARLVDTRKEGRWVYYRVAGPDAPAEVRGVIEWLRASLANDPACARDRADLQVILAMDPNELCRKQGCRCD